MLFTEQKCKKFFKNHISEMIVLGKIKFTSKNEEKLITQEIKTAHM